MLDWKLYWMFAPRVHRAIMAGWHIGGLLFGVWSLKWRTACSSFGRMLAPHAYFLVDLVCFAHHILRNLVGTRPFQICTAEAKEEAQRRV